MTASVTPLAEADRIFSKTLSLKKQRIEVLNLLVQVYERLGQWQNALRYTREEIKLRDENEKDNDASIAAQSEVQETELRYQQDVANLSLQNLRQKRFAILLGAGILICLR